MFAIVRTGGKQYRVAAGDKIVVDRMDGDAGARISLGDVLFASEGATAGLTVAAEIIAQAKADKVIVFKKKRRHNYRRRNGHRQQHTILKIISVGAAQEEPKAKVAESVQPQVEAEATGVAAVPTNEAAVPEMVATTANETAAPVEAAAPVKKPRVKKAVPPADDSAGIASDAAPQE